MNYYVCMQDGGLPPVIPILQVPNQIVTLSQDQLDFGNIPTLSVNRRYEYVCMYAFVCIYAYMCMYVCMYVAETPILYLQKAYEIYVGLNADEYIAGVSGYVCMYVWGRLWLCIFRGLQLSWPPVVSGVI